MPIIAKAFRQVVKDYDDVMTFGKYSGKTVSWIYDFDLEYILWLHEEKIVSFPVDIVEAAYMDDAENSPPEEWYWEPD